MIEDPEYNLAYNSEIDESFLNILGLYFTSHLLNLSLKHTFSSVHWSEGILFRIENNTSGKCNHLARARTPWLESAWQKSRKRRRVNFF